MFIIAQSTYTGIEIGIHSETSLVQYAVLDKVSACAQLIPTLSALLQKEGISLSDIKGIMVNQGPAPFSSLRTVIATMNGLAYATKIPLFGISVFDVLNVAHNPDGIRELLIILRAYSKEYYYALYRPGREPIVATCTIDRLPTQLAPETCIIGHADALNSELLQTLQVISIDYCTLAELARCGLERVGQGANSAHHVSPLYIKNHF